MTDFFFVNSAADSGGNGTTNDLSGGNHAYQSILLWEAARAGALSEPMDVACTGTNTDQTYINGFTGGFRVSIHANTDTGQEHGGDTTAGFELTFASYYNYVLYISDDNITIEDFTVTASRATNGANGGITCAGANFICNRMILRSLTSAAQTIYPGINIGAFSDFEINNTLVYNSFEFCVELNGSATGKIVNSTFNEGNEAGLQLNDATVTLTNVLVTNTVTASADYTGLAGATISNCYGDDTITGIDVWTTQNYNDAGSDDFSLKSDETQINDAGGGTVDSDVTGIDITGADVRGSSTASIGAYELVTGGGGRIMGGLAGSGGLAGMGGLAGGGGGLAGRHADWGMHPEYKSKVVNMFHKRGRPVLRKQFEYLRKPA